MSRPVVVVVGAGPGLGAAVARRFARGGYDVALLARSRSRLAALARELEPHGARVRWSTTDITDAPALGEAIGRFGEDTGRIDVLHYNPSAFRMATPLQLTPDELLEDLRLGVAALLTAVSAARPHLRAGGRVTATGSMAADQPWHEAASLGVQKAALRNLVRSVDATLRPHGVRAASLTVNGTLAADSRFSPELVADAVYALAATPDDLWRTEVPYDG